MSVFNGQSYQKQKGPGTSNQSLFIVQNKFRKIPFLVIHYLTKFDDFTWRSFWIIPKTTSANLCKPIHDIINYSTSICPFESGKFGKEGKKLQKSEYLENEKSFSDEIKNIFHSFWRAIIWWKNKNLIKIADASFTFTGTKGPSLSWWWKWYVLLWWNSMSIYVCSRWCVLFNRSIHKTIFPKVIRWHKNNIWLLSLKV